MAEQVVNISYVNSFTYLFWKLAVLEIVEISQAEICIRRHF